MAGTRRRPHDAGGITVRQLHDRRRLGENRTGHHRAYTARHQGERNVFRLRRVSAGLTDR